MSQQLSTQVFNFFFCGALPFGIICLR